MLQPRPSQADILTYSGGKLRMGVSAVPGSGKTLTLSLLAAQIIARGELTNDQEVLVVTLVNSAVDNFAERIGALVKQRGLLPYLGYRVRTLHGLAHDIVRERPALVGLADDFQIVDEHLASEIRNDVAVAWLQGHPFELDDFLDPALDAKRLDWVRRDVLPDLVKDITLSAIRYAKDHELAPDALAERLAALDSPLPLATMTGEVYADYQRALAYRGAVDFDDLIRLALRALALDDKLLARLRQRWPYILEDEAQDSSRLQEQILRQLVGDSGNWVRVGDPNQAIYETFTTASPQFLLDFLAEAGVVRRELPQSGRSSQSIIDLANHLIDWTVYEHPRPEARHALTPPHIRPTEPGDPQPNPPDDAAAIHLIAAKFSPAAELKAVADSLARWLPEHQDMTVAVLTPRNTRGFELVDELRRRDLEVVDSLLRSATATRLATGSLVNVLKYLADPASAGRLATAFRVWRRADRDDPEAWERVEALANRLKRCRQVEEYLWPRPYHDWLPEQEIDEEGVASLEQFRALMQRWQGVILLPIDQAVLTLAQDLFTAPSDLAMAHKLAALLRQASDDHPDWRLPELNAELLVIANNQRRFLGFSEDDLGFNPNKHKGKVVVATMHKAKGLEWDRVYLMSANSYDFPSGQVFDQYIGEKWYVRAGLNLEAEALAQLDVVAGSRVRYAPGEATEQARLDYVRERLRLLYVGITRAKRELIITWNNGRKGDVTPALPFVALQAFWEERVGGA
jgi:DNA helicase-2/ATP-dependent DNA helicase PcrA